ncbi:hypothetical protein ES705_04859 [subsurface metagenome]
MTAGLPKTIKIEALFRFTSRVARGRVKFSHVIVKGLTLLSSIKLSIFKKAGIFILLFLILIPSRSSAQKIKTEKFFDSKLGREVEVIEGEILVRFKPGLAAEKIKEINQSHGNKTKKHSKKINIHRIQLGKGNKIENMLKMYRKNPNVVFAEPNFVAKTFTTTPSDLFFSQQWGLTKIYAPEAWDIEKGNSNVIIAIVDTGIDLDHPDLDEKIVHGYDFVNEDADPMDDHGHGTHCAGIAAAESNNSQGITGVAWGSKLMPVKALDSAGQGAYSDVAEGIIYAADNGAKVINLSLGAYSYSQTLQDAVDYGYQKGCVIVAASGNDNTNKPLYPAAYSNVIAVAATDQNDERWTSSNYGDYIDVSAPGVNIYSTWLNNDYKSADGTSCSAPFVSGLTGLLLSQDSTLTNYEVENKIRQSADDLGTAGRDDYYGYGRINFYRCIGGLIVDPPSSLHDLAITNVIVIPTDISPGDNAIINITVKNKGSADQNDIPLNLVIETLNINMKKSISRLASGESIVTEFQWATPDIQISPNMLTPIFRLECEVGDISKEAEETRFDNRKSVFAAFNKPTGKLEIKHKVETGKEVHQWIAKEAYDYFVSQFSGSEIGVYLGTISGSHNDSDNNILEGTKDEDVPGENPFGQNSITNHPSFRHLCAGADGSELYDGFGIFGPPIGDDSNGYYSNYEQAYNYLTTYVVNKYSTNKSKAYYYLGHIAHLLADLCVPAHTHNDAHGPIIGGPGQEDEFEETIAYSDNYKLWCYPNPPRYGPSGDIELFTGFYNLFQQTCDYTEEYPSDDNDGDDETGIPNTGFHRPDLVSRSGGIDINEITVMGDDLMPFAMKRVAALYRYFYKRVDSSPPGVSLTYPTSTSPSAPTYVTFTSFNINASASDNISGVDIDDYRFKYCYWTGSSWTSWYDISPSPTTSSVSFTGINNRLYAFYVSASNGAGLTGTSSVKYLMIDVTPPTNPSSPCTESGSVTYNTWQNDDNNPYFTWSGASDSGGSGLKGYSVYWGPSSSGEPGTSYEQSSASYNPSTFSGTYYLRVRTFDNAGNYSSAKTIYIAKYDGTTPINPSSPCSESGSVTYNTWQNDDNNPYFTWSGASDSGGSNLKGYSVYWGPSSSGEPGTSYEQSSASYNPGAFSGTYYLRVRTFDNAGNYSSKKTLYIAKYDGTAPSNPTSCTEVNGAPNNTWQNSVSNPNFTWSGASDGSGSGVNGYYYYWGTNSNGTSSNYTTTSGYNPPSVGNGTYYLRVKTKDNLGNISSWITLFTFKYDSLPPGISIVTSLTHNEDEWNITNNDPLFNWTVPSDLSNIDGFSFKLNHTQDYIPDTVKDCEETITSKQYIDVSDGIWYFHIRARDNAGNWGATDTYGPVKIDLTAPSFSTISSADPAKEGIITMTIVASEQMSVLTSSVTQNGKSPTLLNMNSSDGTTWIGTYTVVSGYDGTATISVSGKDLAGKLGSDLTTFVVDTISPTKSEISSTTHPKNTPTPSSNPSFTWTNSTDAGGSGVAGHSYALNQIKSYNLDMAVETTSTSVSFTKPDGTWWFHLRAVDNAGNGSEIDRYKFIIDTSSPTFIASSSKNPAKAGEVNITIQANEKLKQSPTVTVRQNGQGSATTVATGSSDNITWIGTYTVITGYDGTAVINVSGVDLAENAGIASGNFEVDTIAPTASISMFPTSPLKTGEFQIVLTLTDASNIPQKPSLSYTLSGGLLTSVPLTGSDKSWSGSSYIDSTAPESMAMFSFSATDAAGNIGTTITAGETFEIDTTIDASSGGTSSNSDGTMVNVPQDAFSENVNIRITYPDPNLSEIREADNNIIDDKGIKPIKTGNLYREIVAVSDIYGNEIENSDKPVTISIPYPDEDQNGMVDGTTIEEETLRMFHLDETLKKWILVPNSQVDSTGNNVSAEINNFSIYTLMQLSAPSSLSEVFGYPNPCYVKKDGYVRISNIPLDAKNVKIYIYNVAGELVRVLEEHEEIETQVGSKIGKWDGKNEDKEMVASGIYIYLIKSEGSKKTEKIAIFW